MRDLCITLPAPRGRQGGTAVRGVEFALPPGRVHALVGESGAGKSLTARALLGLLPHGAVASGSARLDGTELLGAGRRVRSRLWGRAIGYVPQDSLSVLSPVHTVGDQLAASLRSVAGLGRRTAWEGAVAALERVGIADAARRARSHPHEFSGGMRQRAVIALATLHRPSLLVADEPTTALDPLVQEQVLSLLAEQRAVSGAALLLITHDLPLVARHADTVTVLHAGRAHECGPVADVLRAPESAHTAALLAAARGHRRPSASPLPSQSPSPSPSTASEPLLRVRDVTVRHRPRRRGEEPVRAVDRASFEVAPGETLALIGASGSGKTSLAEAVLRLREPAAGSVEFAGQELTGLGGAALRRVRPLLQPVFQDPFGSLSPRQRIRDAVAEPLRAQGRWDAAGGPARVTRLLEQVGLDDSYGDRRPHELSGGQCQRAGIARALACEPRLIVLDEAVSGLDPTIRAGILGLLTDLQRELGLAYLFITHDMALVRGFAHRVAVLREGRIVEELEAADLTVHGAQHPYTRALLAAVPELPTATGPRTPTTATATHPQPPGTRTATHPQPPGTRTATHPQPSGTVAVTDSQPPGRGAEAEPHQPSADMDAGPQPNPDRPGADTSPQPRPGPVGAAASPQTSWTRPSE
ncbi:nickel ABC transporter ATP-binding protein NikE [Streptomyces monticola]|uniref:Nickel ABC transporter ATP-binding protein NikE n=1 Tax=Streptomyces monticola TaxID=2666263 RepID=A0ABW2JE80_9ACTN